MAKKILSIDDIGTQTVDTRLLKDIPYEKKNSPYEELPLLTREEALIVLSEALYDNALLTYGSTNTNPRLTINDRVTGAVYTVLKVLQNGKNGYLPPFNLAPVLPLDGSAEEPTAYMERPSGEVECRWPEDPIPLEASATDPVSMTSVFCDVYDRYKERLAASARDLFQN